MDIDGRLRHALLWLGSTAIVWQIISWMLTLVTVRVLSPADYGIAAFAETVTPFVGLIAGFNLTTWLVQTPTVDSAREQSAASLAGLLGVAAAALTVTVAPLLARFYEAPAIRLPLQLVGITFLLQAVQTIPTARLQRDFRFKPIALMNLIGGISRSVLTLGLALLGFGYWALFLGILYNDIVRSIWLVATAGFPHGLRWDTHVNRAALTFGLPVTAASILWLIYSTSDNIVVGKLFSAEILGIYATAFYLSELPIAKINSIIQPTLLPYYCGLRDDRGKLFDAFLGLSRSTACAVYPVLAGMAVVASEAVPLVLGTKWVALVQPLRIMCCVSAIRLVTMNTQAVFLALGEPRSLFIFHALNSVVLPPSFLLLAWWIGINGIYATWLFVFPMTSFFGLLLLQRVTGITPTRVVTNLRTPLVASLFMAASVAAVGAAIGPWVGPLPMLVVKIVVGVLVYGLLLWHRVGAELAGLARIVRGPAAS